MSTNTTHRIPAGTYRAQAVPGSEQYGTTSGGNDQIVVEIELLDLGERASTFLVFSDAAAPYAIDRLRAMGWTGGDLTNLEGLGSQECEVLVKYEFYDGKDRMKVEVLTGGGRVVLKDQLDEKGKKAFAAKYADIVKQKPATAPKASGGSKPLF